MKSHYQVIIIGAGPSGIGVATALHEKGIDDIIILDREKTAGGVPRHCQHPTFGIQTYHRLMKGSTYVKKILSKIPNVEIATQVDVCKIKPHGEIDCITPGGLKTITANYVVLATGVRETPRHPRLITGLRPAGIMTTGALQQFVYLKKLLPCKKPIIVGTELVSFSALWTLKQQQVKAVAMIEENNRTTAYRVSPLFAKIMGTPIYYKTHISDIEGLDRVEGITIKDEYGNTQHIECDSVIFTGQFTGEYTLIRDSHLAYNPRTGCPITNSFSQCSDPSYFSVGNMMHPADMGDQCYQEGLKIGCNILGTSQTEMNIPISFDNSIAIGYPTALSPNYPTTINIRVKHQIQGIITVSQGNHILLSKKKKMLPARRILLKNIIPKNKRLPIKITISN